MAINFESLPTSKPNNTLPNGPYYAKIDKAEMTKAKTPGKADYLNLQLSLFDQNKASKGKVFDILTESEAPLARYKLGRFISALKIPLTEFELGDLAKIIPGKEFIVDITLQETEGYAPRNVVDALTNEIYYPVDAASTIFDGVENAPFTATDSVTGNVTEDTEY